MLACFSQSTAHGLAHIGNEPFFIGKLVWFFLTIAAVSIFSLHTYTLSTQFFDEQVFVYTQPNKVEFLQPDIVFCSDRIFARDYISDPPENEYDYMLNVSKSIQEFDVLYRKFKYKSTKLIWDSLNSHQLFKAFYHRKHQFLLNVTCNFDQIDLSHFKAEFSFNHFACYRLKSNVCKLDSPFNSLILKFYVHIYGTNDTENELNVNINGQPIDSYLFIQKEYIDEVGDGIHIYFVQPNEAIHGRTKRVLASANTLTDIRIKSTLYTKIHTTKSPCQEVVKYDEFYNLLDENPKRNPLKYTEHSLCMLKQFQLLYYKMFRCVSKQLPIPVTMRSNVAFCGDLFKQKEFVSAVYSNMTTGKLYSESETLRKCKGTIPCSVVKYQSTVNYNTWPWKKTLIQLLSKDIPNKLDRDGPNLFSPGLREAVDDYINNPSKLFSWTKNFIKVTISSDEFMSTLVEESPSYSLKNFFSDVGGIMGFYMGASLLTLCELFRVIYFTLYSMFYSKQKVDDNDNHSTNEVQE